jgi:hypothetical protein
MMKNIFEGKSEILQKAQSISALVVKFANSPTSEPNDDNFSSILK